MYVKIQRNTNYSINQKGEVRNDKTGRLKTPYLNKATGYLVIDLWDNNKSHKVPLHRLFAEAFIPNPYNKPTIDHVDGNKINNSIKNLRWATYSEQNSRFHTCGVRSEKISATHYKERRKKRGGGHDIWLDVDRIMYFDKVSYAAEYFGTTIGNISFMLQKGSIGQRGKMRGYKFEYSHGERKKLS